MALANTEIKSFGTLMVDNLKELAKFDRDTACQKMWGSKLNIEENGGQGKFTKVNGAWAAKNRGEEASLTKDYNRKTVLNLIKAAISEFEKGGEKDNPLLRKAIIDGIRGYSWLLNSYGLGGGRNRAAFDKSLNELQEVNYKFMSKLRDAVFRMQGFHSFFIEAQPEVSYRGVNSQFDYEPNQMLVGGGICAGITIKWLTRWVSSEKASILDSSKQSNLLVDNNKIQQEVQRFKRDSRAKWVGLVAKFNGDAAAAETALKDDIKLQIRLQKKGSGMYIAMYEQSKFQNGGNLQNIIENADRYKDKIEEIRDKAAMAPNTAKFVVDPNNPFVLKSIKGYKDDAEKVRAGEAAELAKRRYGLEDNDQAGEIRRNIARNYKNAFTNVEIINNFKDPMYCRDSKDFYDEIKNHFERLTSDSQSSKNSLRTGYYITWTAGQSPYDNMTMLRKKIGNESGHALGFHINEDGRYFAFDPNYGEFRVNSDIDLINLFSRWFSVYSRDTTLIQFGSVKVVQMVEDWDFGF